MNFFEGASGRVAIVTGAGSGIGEALAHELAVSHNMHVIVTDVVAERAHLVAHSIEQRGGQATAHRVDVSRERDVSEFSQHVLTNYEPPALLVCNAGVEHSARLWDTSYDSWRKVLGVGLDGVFLMCRSLLPSMISREERGHVLITSSIGALGVTGLQGAYTVSKHASKAFGESLARDLEEVQAPIGVSVLLPAAVNTRIFTEAETSGDEAAESLRERFAANLATVGLAPGDVARIACQGISENRLFIHTHPDRAAVFIERYTAKLAQSLQ